jgi:hypothetical protein
MAKSGPKPKSLEDIKANWNQQYTVEDRGYKTPCWIWKKSLNPKGYARCVFQRRTYTGGRLPWIMFMGPIPKGLFVCHDCDQPPCVNPDHMFIGTNVDNMRDCRNKGRTLKGVKNSNAKLNDQKVREMRLLYKKGLTQKEVAEKFPEVNRVTVRDVLIGERWTHVI